MTGADPAIIGIQDFYSRLNEIGLPRPFVKKFLLPEWWVPECEAEPDAVVEAAAYVARRANLDFNSLIRVNDQPRFKDMAKPCYKLKAEHDSRPLVLPQAIACRVAELVAYTYRGNHYDRDKRFSVQDIRSKILLTHKQENRLVNLQSLLEFCWEIGIPVVYVSHFPDGQKKFDGMVGFFGDGKRSTADRPVIVVSKKHRFSAWLAFILAHELGHLMKGHVQDSPIIDEQINPSQNEDEQEIEADEFALELLFGKTNPSYFQLRNLKAETLARYAEDYSAQDQVDSGAIALNYAWYKAHMAADQTAKRASWATAQSALKILEKNANAPKLINHYLRQSLDLEQLSEDNQEFLERMIEV
ncbi:MAG: ImmA/IrrE family metallo-endopeptidase [Cyanobacteriota bacterium]